VRLRRRPDTWAVVGEWLFPRTERTYASEVALNPGKIGYFNIVLQRANKRPPYLHLAPSREHYGPIA
jgi:hypothetical protein